MFKRTFARTIPDNLRAPHMKMWGFEAKKGQKVHPNFALTTEFHYHAFCAPEVCPPIKSLENPNLLKQGL